MKTETEKQKPEQNFGEYLKLVARENAEMRERQRLQREKELADRRAHQIAIGQKVEPLPPPPKPPAEQLDIPKAIAASAVVIGWKNPAAVVAKIETLQYKRDKIFQYRKTLADQRFVTTATIERAGRAMVDAESPADFIPDLPLSKGARDLELQSRKRQAESALRLVLADAVELCKPVMADFIVACEKHFAEVESAERALAAKYCVPYQQSPLLTELKRLLPMVKKIIPQNPGVLSFQNPKQFLPPSV